MHFSQVNAVSVDFVNRLLVHFVTLYEYIQDVMYPIKSFACDHALIKRGNRYIPFFIVHVVNKPIWNGMNTLAIVYPKINSIIYLLML